LILSQNRVRAHATGSGETEGGSDGQNHGGILHATKITSRGRETGYIDQIDAYERLPDEVKERIDDLEVVYRFGPPESSPFCCRESVRYLKVGPANRSMYARAERDWPPVVHPLVFTQAETGRKALNLSPRFAQHVLGIERQESDELLTILSNHLWDSPAYYHRWGPDEMVLWDNWRMLHRVTPAPYEEVRIVERTTLEATTASAASFNSAGPPRAVEVKPSTCRACSAYCPVLVTLDGGQVVQVRGNPAVPMYNGFTCPKGRALPALHANPRRLLHSLKRLPDGRFTPIPTDVAIAEIAERLVVSA
jgi:hypothetical protein